MSIAALIRQMSDAGAPPEAIAIAVEAIEAAQAKDAERRAAVAARKARQRAGQSRDSHATVTATSQDTPPSDKEKSPEPPKEITSPHSPPKGGSYTPRSALEAVLDSERAQSVVEHRQRIGKPLTPNAARLLARKLAQWPDANEAADEMVANGWQGFKPGWMVDRTTTRSTGPPKPKPKTLGDMFRDDAKRMGIIPDDKPTDPTNGRLETGDRSREGGGSGIARRFTIEGDVVGRG